MKKIDQQLLDRIQELNFAEVSNTIAHDLKNPLAAITYAIALQSSLVESAKPLDIEKIKGITKNIENSLSNLEGMTNKLRNLARSQPVEEITSESIAQLLDQTLNLLQTRISDLKITVNLEPIPENITLECRKHQLIMALSFLLNNSCDALRDSATKEMTIRVKELEEKIVIELQDSGDGITSEIKDNMLNSFYSGDSSGRRLGMGLCMMKRILDQQGGNIALPDIGPNPIFKVTLNKLFHQ